MSYQDRLRTEIHAALDSLATEQKPWVAQWIANAICNSHADGLADNDHKEFWRHCAYMNCRDEVRRCINMRAGDQPEQEGEQIKLFGWQHLHAYYVVNRDGEDIGVPINDLTDEEMEAKAESYRKMAATCYAHAEELDRFRRERRRLSAA